MTGKRSNIFRSEVTRWYFGMLLAGGVLIAVSLFAADIYPTLTASFRYAMFQFVSVVTTTGFATADSNTWTSFAVILLIFGSIVCACAGSTAGGIKVNRLVLAGKTRRLTGEERNLGPRLFGGCRAASNAAEHDAFGVVGGALVDGAPH